MKCLIKTSVGILLTLSLHAESIERTDANGNTIIIPDCFSSQNTYNPPIQNNQITDSTDYIDNTPIIIPESFKNSQHIEPTTQIEIVPESNISNGKTAVVINDSDIDIAPEEYSGYYRFIKGSDSFRGMFESIDNGFLVIEKLDDNDFGFYYVIQSKKFPPNEKYGIFHYKNGKFFQKFINDPVLRDNVDLKKSGISLETDIATNKGTQAIQWEVSEKDEINNLNSKLQKSLKDAKENYRQIYKEKFKN